MYLYCWLNSCYVLFGGTDCGTTHVYVGLTVEYVGRYR